MEGDTLPQGCKNRKCNALKEVSSVRPAIFGHVIRSGEARSKEEHSCLLDSRQ